MIILLDLNYTLVANSNVKKAPFIRQIAVEEYRKDLIQLVRQHYVILITARPARFESATLESIENKTSWVPDRAIFNTTVNAPHIFKKKVATELVMENNKSLLPKRILAIESNPRTIEEYKKLGILCLSVR